MRWIMLPLLDFWSIVAVLHLKSRPVLSVATAPVVAYQVRFHAEGREENLHALCGWSCIMQQQEASTIPYVFGNMM